MTNTNSDIQTHWTAIINNTYIPYKEQAQIKFAEDRAVYSKLGVNLLDMDTLKPVGVKFLNIILDINKGRYWFFNLFQDGDTFFKYIELFIYNVSSFEVFKRLAAEYDETGKTNTINERISSEDFEKENNELISNLFEGILFLHSIPQESQEETLKGIKEGMKNNTNEEILETAIQEAIDPAKNFYSILQNSGVNMLSTIRTRKQPKDANGFAT